MNGKIGARLAVGVAVVAGLGAAGWFGFLEWSRARVRAEVDAAFAGIRETGARAAFADATFNPREMGITITGISVISPDGGARVKVDRLSARGGERPVDRRVSLEALDLDGVEITLTGDSAAGGTITYTLPQVMIDRYSGPMTLIAAGEGNGPYGAVRVALRQLAATTAAKVTIPEARAQIAPAGAPPAEASYRDFAAEGVNAGAIRSLVVDRVTYAFTPPAPAADPAAKPDAASPGTGSSGAPGRVTGQVDGLVAAQIDTAPLLAMTQPGGPAGKAAEAYGRLYGKIVTGPYVVKQENGPSHGAAALLIEDLAIRPAAFEISRMEALNALSRKAPTLTPQENRRLAELSRDLINGIAFRTLAITRATSEVQGETGRIATIRLEGMTGGVLDGFTMEGVEGATAGGGVAKLERLAIRQLDFNQMARLAAEAENPTPLSAMLLFKVLSGFELKGLDMPYGEGPNPSEPVRVGTLALSWGGSLGALPSYLDFTLDGVSGPIRPDDGEPFATLGAAGFTRATVSMAFKAHYDINDRRVTLAPISTEVKDAFRMNVETTLEEVPDTLFTDPAAMLTALPAVAAGPVKLTLTDLGMARLVLSQLAAADGLSVDAYREELVSLAEGIAADLAVAAPEIAPVGEAVVAFLRDPGTLTITATPKGRVPFLALAGSSDPSVLLEAFTLSATATKP